MSNEIHPEAQEMIDRLSASLKMASLKMSEMANYFELMSRAVKCMDATTCIYSDRNEILLLCNNHRGLDFSRPCGA